MVPVDLQFKFWLFYKYFNKKRHYDSLDENKSDSKNNTQD
jgi:hypothetical protein